MRRLGVSGLSYILAMMMLLSLTWEQKVFPRSLVLYCRIYEPLSVAIQVCSGIKPITYQMTPTNRTLPLGVSKDSPESLPPLGEMAWASWVASFIKNEAGHMF